MSPKSTGGQKADQKPVEVGGPARAAARPLSFAEALLYEGGPGFNTLCAGGAADFKPFGAPADPFTELPLRALIFGLKGVQRSSKRRTNTSWKKRKIK